MTADKILIARSAAGRLSIAIGMPVRNRLRVLAAGCLVLGALLALAGCAPTPAQDFTHQTQETTNGDFAAALIVPVGNKPMTVATADFDNDGLLDIAVTNQLQDTDATSPALPAEQGTLTVLLNHVTDGFTVPDAGYSIADAGIRPSRVLAGDLDGDGFPDLVFLHTGQAHADGSTHADEGFHKDNSFIRVLLNTYPLPGWTAAEIDLTGLIFQIELVDLNGDSALDIVVSLNSESEDFYVPGIVALLNYGSGGFPPGPPHDRVADTPLTDLGENTPSWDAADDTADAAGPGTGNHPTRFVVGDWNGDTIPDLAVLNFTQDLVNILLGNGDGTFDPSQPASTTANTVAVGSNPFAIVGADSNGDPLDFNGDGNADLAVSNRSSGTVSILLGDNLGVFTKAPSSPLGLSEDSNHPERMVAGDFSSGGVDLAVVDRLSNRIAFLDGDGGGSFDESTLTVSSDPFDLRVVDIDGDGNDDLLSVEGDLWVLSVLAGAGDGTLTRTVVGFEHRVGAPELADLDGDGFMDLVLVQRDFDSVVVLLNCHGPSHTCP